MPDIQNLMLANPDAAYFLVHNDREVSVIQLGSNPDSLLKQVE